MMIYIYPHPNLNAPTGIIVSHMLEYALGPVITHMRCAYILYVVGVLFILLFECFDMFVHDMKRWHSFSYTCLAESGVVNIESVDSCARAFSSKSI